MLVVERRSVSHDHSVGVVILNYHSTADTLRCLESLGSPEMRDVQVLVVDNAAESEETDQLRASVGTAAETIVTGSNLGYAAGNNLGIGRLRDCGADLVWILNPDTVVEPDTLGLLIDHLDDTPDCGIVGPRVLRQSPWGTIGSDGGAVDRVTGGTWHLHEGQNASATPAARVDVDYVTGASMLVRCRMLDAVGMIPEDYFLYYEETDWCLRAQRAGWRTMVERRATITHSKRSSGALPAPFYLYYMTRNRLLFAERCLGADGEEALADLDAEFLRPWRARVQEEAPELVIGFDQIVAAAKEDARGRRTGERPGIAELSLADAGRAFEAAL